MAIPKITGSGPNSRTNLKNIHSGERSFQKDLSTTHSQISLMQQALTSLGYNTKGTDGIFGDNTASAVKSFQRACNLTADGYFGKNSLLNLEKLLGHHLDPDADGCGDTGSSGSGDSGSGDNGSGDNSSGDSGSGDSGSGDSGSGDSGSGDSGSGDSGSGDSGSGDNADAAIQVGDTVITTKPAVYFRKEPDGSYHMKVDKGTTMKVTAIEDRGKYKWYEGVISGKIGYLRGDCVEKYTGSTSSDSTIQVGDTVITTKTGVNFRQTPNGTPLMQVKKGTTMKVTAIKDSDKYKWYEGTIDDKIGYLRGDCVEKYTGSSGGSSSSGGNTGSSNDFTDIVTTTPTVNTYYPFSASKAIEYALAHSSNKTGVADPKRNPSFRETERNACANFVHQCLLAGGARMFDGWCYKLSGIPSSWDNSTWIYTNSARRKLLEKGWIRRVEHNEDVHAGDIIYTYNSSEKAQPTPFTHVTMAVSDYDSSINGCYVCGHTENQNHRPKSFIPDGTKSVYCYHVAEQLGGDGTEKAIDLTNGKSKAI